MMNPEEVIKKIQTEAFEKGEQEGLIQGKKDGKREGIQIGYRKGLEVGEALIFPKNDDKILEVLQMLALIKIEKYKAKWSKSSEDSIKRLEDEFNDVDKLTIYFTKK